ncbi:tryptophan synthase beta subunit-like PLP-dependent enzyme [Aureobasidium pullulans]|nr:tryptophan synthase beta subunit-like PLP-dependent enzyme [Aureobasidium pullulans]
MVTDSQKLTALGNSRHMRLYTPQMYPRVLISGLQNIEQLSLEFDSILRHSYVHRSHTATKALGMDTLDRKSTTIRSSRMVCLTILLSRVFLKLDNLQPSGSFKSRGVGNYVLQRAAERITSSATPNSTHFYAASGGNAGIACVHAARMLGYPATVVVPKSAKPVMIAKIWAMGVSKVIQHGSTIAEAQEYILNTLLPADPTGVFVPPFDHQDIWDGNATVMQEIASQLGDKPDVVVCSVGGGGLLNGIMQELDDKKWNNDVQVLAMETKGADSLRQSLDAGHIITLPRITSQATSLGVVRVAEKTYEYAQRPNVTSVVLSDEEAAKGCCLLAEHERMMVELTVGVNVPVCFDGFLQRLLASKKTITKDSKVVLVVCGGNDISLDMLMAWRMAMVGSETVQESTTSMTARVGATGVTA